MAAAAIDGREAATVVNNNAAATWLVLNAVAAGREVIVSRGQLVEIGGSFRLPDVMAASGAKMVEVGTTNMTHPGDYQRAITADTAAILRVHPSNYTIRGFTAEVPLEELVAIAHAHGLAMIDDVGAGALLDLSRFGLDVGPTLAGSLRAGADLVTASTDKLIGAVAGRHHPRQAALMETVRKNPLARIVPCGQAHAGCAGGDAPAVLRRRASASRSAHAADGLPQLGRARRRGPAHRRDDWRAPARGGRDRHRRHVADGRRFAAGRRTCHAAGGIDARDFRPRGACRAAPRAPPAGFHADQQGPGPGRSENAAGRRRRTVDRSLYGGLALMSVSASRITLGTAGHIDHGKTALVRSLTGCETDRLKEEKERGMSIDLGFAPCTIPGTQVGIVDVPGHENFIKTMVAGANGMDGVILVVAADDGVMPQTREHLEILTLLGLRHGLVALTKIDRVADDLREMARPTWPISCAAPFWKGPHPAAFQHDR